MKKRPIFQAWLMILTGIGIILFWLVFFCFHLVPENAPDCYLAFEYSFPPPDGLLALGLISAGLLVIGNRPAGARLSLACAGGLIFLGVIDISFNIQNNIYGMGLGEFLSMAAINIWCVAFGASLLIWPVVK